MTKSDRSAWDDAAVVRELNRRLKMPRPARKGAIISYSLASNGQPFAWVRRTADDTTGRPRRIPAKTVKRLLGQRNPGHLLRLRNFTGTITRTNRGQVLIRGRGKRA
jgi:hypothetical protein